MTEVNFENQTFPWKNEAGNMIEIPALDPRWVEDRKFPLFAVLQQSEQVKIDAWCCNVEHLIKSCKWLLRLPHHKFWSFVVYGDKSLHEMLDSYLLNCPRYTQPELMNRSFFVTKTKISDLQNTLDHNIFLIFLRMSTRREGGICQSSEFFGKLVYDNCIFDIPRMMDLCALYGTDNERTIQRMIDHIFKCQPQYYSDLKDVCAGVLKMLEKCVRNVDTSVGEAYHLLKTGPSSRYNDRIAFDAIHYLVDFVYSFNMFFKFCPKASKIFHENGLTEKLPSLYEKTYTQLYEAVYNSEVARFNATNQHLLERLIYFERNLVILYRHLVCYNSLNHLLNSDKKSEDNKSKSEYLNDFITSMTNLANEKQFATAYNSIFWFQCDVENLKQQNIDIDSEHFTFLTEAFSSLHVNDTKEFVPVSYGTAGGSSFSNSTKFPPARQRANEIFEDKSFLKDSRAVYEKYDYVVSDDNEELTDADIPKPENRPIRPQKQQNIHPPQAQSQQPQQQGQIDLYDDEYDDTYDSHNVNVEESNTLDENESQYRRKEMNNQEENDNDELVKCSSSEENNPNGGRNWKGQYTGGRDRHYKERNKARFAHHDRKDRALYKHSRGFGFF